MANLELPGPIDDAWWAIRVSRKLIEQILDFVKPHKDAQIVIFGPSGSGKTTVMSEVFGVELGEISMTTGVTRHKGRIGPDEFLIVDPPGDRERVRMIRKELAKINTDKRVLLIYIGAGGFRCQKPTHMTPDSILRVRTELVRAADGELPTAEDGVNRAYFEKQMDFEFKYFQSVFEFGILEHFIVSGLIVIGNKRDFWEHHFGPSFGEEIYGNNSRFHKLAAEYMANNLFRYHQVSATWESFFVEPNIEAERISRSERVREFDAIHKSVLDLIPKNE